MTNEEIESEIKDRLTPIVGKLNNDETRKQIHAILMDFIDELIEKGVIDDKQV